MVSGSPLEQLQRLQKVLDLIIKERGDIKLSELKQMLIDGTIIQYYIRAA